MAQQTSSLGDTNVWNPAFWPEDDSHRTAAAPTEGGLADLLAAANPKHGHTSDLKSPLSDGDFSAWDMPLDTTAIIPEDSNEPAPVVENPPVQDTAEAGGFENVNHATSQDLNEPLLPVKSTEDSSDSNSTGVGPAQALPPPAEPTEIPVETTLSSADAQDSISAPPANDVQSTNPQESLTLAEVVNAEYKTVPAIETTGQPADPKESRVEAAAVAEPKQPQAEQQPAPEVETILHEVQDSLPDPIVTFEQLQPEQSQLEKPHPEPFQAEQLPTPPIGLGHVVVSQAPTTAAAAATTDVPLFETEAPTVETNTNDADLWGVEAHKDVDSDGDDFFNQLKTQTKPIFAPPEAESRFEEGVSLLEEDSPISPVRAEQPQRAAHDPFASDEDDAEGFFSSAQNPERSQEPSLHITRKSTSQVLESVGFSVDSPSSDSSAAAQFDDILKAAATSGPTESSIQTEAGEPSEEDLAARWEAELSETGEDELAARWEAALDLEDDDMLLEDDAPAQPQASGQQYVPQSPFPSTTNAGPTGLNSPFETSQSQTRPGAVPGMYTPHQPPTADLVGGISVPGAPPSVNASIPPFFSQQPSNPVATRGESFAERSKEGYKSPYDLPDDLSRPRKFTATHKAPLPVSSMPPPPLPNKGMPQYGALPAATAPPAAPTAPPAPKNFYEELPLPVPKSRPATSSGRYSPNPAAAPTTGPTLAPPPQNPYAAAAPPAAVSSIVPSLPSLQPPELLDPYAAPPTLASSAPGGPPVASRYSPKPQDLQPLAKPPSQPRYSPAPPPSGPAARNRYASQPLTVPGHVNNLPFQPRTSSPLAYHEKVSYQPDEAHARQPQPPSLQPSVDLSPPRAQRPSVDQGSPYAAHLPNGLANVDGPSPPVAHRQTPPPPKNRYAPPEYVNEFAQRVAPNNAYAPVQATAVPSYPATDSQAAPRRSLTSSPGQQMTSPRAIVPPITTLPRSASVHGSSSPTKTINMYEPAPPSMQSRARALSQHLEFIAPTDGQEQDPLQRWKGAPIFKFGFGGAVVSCFPQQIPRYAAGQVTPMIKPSPGEPRFSHINQWVPSPETIVQHPGPLKSKSKKKDVLAWLSSKIAVFENEMPPGFDRSHPVTQKRYEEKILLWKVVKILVENDGNLEGSPAVQNSLRQVFVPKLTEPGPEGSLMSPFGTSGGFASLGVPSQPDVAADPQWTEELRDYLLLGEREKAVWAAVDRRLWGHAMILASTMDRSIWKQAVQEFVRREIRSTTTNTESLAALYEIFAGNVEESVDELVPPSARAGHQLISRADGHGSSKNVLDGLDSWRDTVGLVLSNRSSEDHQALLALGRLLASYGRVEAAHICFIFSRGATFGGADDPQANIVLLGADHQRLPCSLMDEDAILLTEIYEFATSVLANSPVASFPYLLAFKLLHAKQLADRGYKSEAQTYCDVVAASLKATTRPSPYHHQHLFIEVDELSARLRQTATDGGSWISKPSMEKVSGSMWARFNSFVVGDDSDAASTASGKAGETADFGPFANVAGTPTVSRSPSVSDLYGSYPGAVSAQPIPAPAGGSSRYLPNQYAPNASPEQFRGRSSMDSQRSTSFGGVPFGQRRTSQEYPASPVESYAPMYGSPGTTTGYQPTPPQTSYMPLAPVDEDSTTQSPANVAPAAQPAVNGLFYQPPGQQDQTSDIQSPYYQGPPDMPQPEASAYMPPPSHAYAPTSYTPAMNPPPEQPGQPSAMDEEPQPKKKSFMDDDEDDDLASRAAAMQKSENDRKADEAFRKAAEEDAKRDAQQTTKKGWFGGWFGGGKKEAENAGGGPIKAKLGEDSSFYYDKDLKKWVNKKDPNSAAAVRATPPPPRGSAPPSRAASSGSMPPPSGPPMSAAGSRPQSSSSDMPPPFSSSPALSGLGGPPPLGSLPRSVSTGAAVPTPPGSSAGPPPPRPSSSLTHASSIDDLLGAPTARKGNTIKGKKKGRYVDVMAQ
ncbi:COPII coat assembly protein sec16 [Penicillium canariense]|uniref:Protein transport protein sec16 n=1 Tax=Penicillium canariense TaxID=189055 RepID=A0A9W9I7K4_9EURO|nr:COPII coat assembly protein sec16 [Penicillium canariense]KAJ5166442.1 COPII coat assembly protein sec16 [Penicillium canariense]